MSFNIRYTRTSFSKTHAKQQGIVLLAVLVLLLIISLVITGANLLLESRLNLALSAKQNLHNKAAAISKANQLTYLLATQRLTIAGISQGINPEGFARNEDDQFINRIVGDEIRVDGYVYEFEQKQFSYSIQSQRGLLSVNTRGQRWLKKWIQSQNQDALQTNRMLDSLFDYADGDNIQKPAGKDGKNYQNIRNYLLQSCSELFLVQHWQAFLTLHSEFLSHCSLQRSSVLNLNQVPLSLWRIFWPTSIDRLIEMRDSGLWFSALSDAYLVEPSIAGLSEQHLSTLGGQQFSVTVSYPITNSQLQNESDLGRAKESKLKNQIVHLINVGSGNNPPIVIKP